MVFGSYYCLTGRFDAAFIFLASLPIGLLVIGILHANNTRDIDDDRRAQSYTFAGLIGFEGSKLYYAALIILAYATVSGLVFTNMLPLGALLALVTVKPAVNALRNVLASTAPGDARLDMADVVAAQLHLAFGMTLMLGTIASALFI
jgi:1,4-dihydroxy-2-naphthoate octaprenyltransferase